MELLPRLRKSVREHVALAKGAFGSETILKTAKL
jgi:hypothetical protein